MREIKFRGKCVEDGKWMVGSLYTDQNGASCILDSNNDGDESIYCRFILVSRESVGQYTGLHDKNGKEIYEGDILQFIDMRSKDEPKRIGVVRFHCGSFEVQCGYGSFGNWLNMKYGVVGNIYENPDLLEG